MSKAAKLADIAQRCGVAASTVSRALSNPTRVNPVTRERIEQVARELNYVSGSQSRTPIHGRTRAIAVLVSDVTNPFYFGIIRGTQQQLKAANYTQILIDTEESDELEIDKLHQLRLSFDGAILSASRLSDQKLKTLSSHIPLIAINRNTPDVPSVLIDTPGGMEQTVGHLASLGHKEVIYAAGPNSSWANEGRWRGISHAAKQYGMSAVRIGPFAPRVYSGAAAADAALISGATSCIAFNDLLAIGMLERFQERGVRVPKDISLIGCDDIFGADICRPALTTLKAPIERAGRTAVSMLLAQLNQDPATAPQPSAPQNVILPTHLTVRSSTGIAPH